MSEPAHSLSDLPAGTMVGAYRVDRRLGAGGMGTVYAGVEPTIGKKVAIKVLKHAFAEDSAAVERFKREAQAANEIGHPGIVDVFAIGTLADSRPYLVMSLLEGRTLRDELGARGRFPGVEAWTIAREIAEALAAAHERGIVHRDLKPDNVFLERVPNRPPRARLLDFGLAKMTEGKGSDLEKLTGTGMLMGTPAYMAPEQWWASGIEAATDQYALGAMIFEMLSGGPPFRAAQYAGLLQQHLHERPPSLASVGTEAGAPIEALVARMLAKSAKDRYPSMSDVLVAGDTAFGVAPPSGPMSAPVAKTEVSFAETVASAPVPVPTPVDPRVRRAALLRFLAVFAGIAAVGVAGVVAVGYTGAERHSPSYWMRIGGWGARATSILSIVAVLAILATAVRRVLKDVGLGLAWGFSLFATFSGALGTYTGWRKVVGAIGGAPPSERFRIFSLGMYESNACRFIGLSLGTMLFLGVAALAGLRGAKPSRAAAAGTSRRESLLAMGGLGLVAVVAAVVRVPSGALVAGVAAAALGIAILVPATHPERAAKDELERMVWGTLAVLLAVGAGFARIEAREGVLWEGTLSRAARAREILAAASERRATLVIAIACIVAVVAVEALRVRRLRRGGVPVRPTPWRALTLAGLLVLVFGDMWATARMDSAREEYRSLVAAQFSLVGLLEPPRATGYESKHAPPAAPSLQVSRDAVVVQGQAVTRLHAAAASRDRRISQALNRALTSAVEGERTADAPDLSVTVDRAIRWRELSAILSLARDEGARRIDFLLVKTPAPRLDPSAPPEARLLTPEDFVAVPVVLDPAGEVRPSPEDPFGAVARRLLTLQTGTARIAL